VEAADCSAGAAVVVTGGVVAAEGSDAAPVDGTAVVGAALVAAGVVAAAALGDSTGLVAGAALVGVVVC
jgi:hypothetical protein